MASAASPPSDPPRLGRPPAAVVLTEAQRVVLERTARASTSPQREALRARVVLAAAAGASSSAIAAQLQVSVDLVSTWRGRFARLGLDGLGDRPRSGRPPRLTPVERCGIMAVACEPAPAQDGLNGWTLDRLCEEVKRRGVAKIERSHLHTLLARADLRPHKHKMWLHSPDPMFREKVAEIVDLYLDPPEGSTVLCVDEKTGMQAIERKHPDRPARPGALARREFEYVRHGTQTLIAAFQVHDGVTWTHCGPTRKGDDLEAFMDGVAARVPGRIDIIWDNLNIHHGERWERFNARYGGRFHFHYTPLHASWVNQVELWFGVLQRRCLAKGSFVSVEALRSAVESFVVYWNTQAKHPFRWSFTGFAKATPSEGRVLEA